MIRGLLKVGILAGAVWYWMKGRHRAEAGA